MRLIQQLFVLLILLGSLAAIPAQAETFHTCGTIIASVPTVITTAGVYCLSHDVNTAITTGSAIAINTNNVTLDCNGFKIGGLAAGTSSLTTGILADTRQNITVRNCGIRGFYEGIYLVSGAGHLIEDNRLDNNLYVGINAQGDNIRVQRNRVYDTGGYPGNNNSVGIIVAADVIDNTVVGVFATATNSAANGIEMTGDGTEARGNQVRGLVASGTGGVAGINVFGSSITMRGNTLALSALTTGDGIDGSSKDFCTGNMISNFSTPIFSCQDAGGNASN
jgi:parallel beta-helix repeat protein